jgi:glyoxylase-like metal-dependent hydrolase (beta-lactamase superfamily II)
MEIVMKQTQMTDSLIQLTRLHFVNAFLVREDDGFTLVDTGLPGAAAKLIDAAHNAGGEIRRIALTHGHSDHIGSLDQLKEKLGAGAEVFLGDADLRIINGAQLYDGKRRGSWPKTLATKPDVLLQGGETIGSLEVVATPGHTPGHVAFVDSRDRTVLAGDTFTSYFRLEIPNRATQPFPLAAMGTQDRVGVLAAARTVQSLGPALLVVGHGPAVRNPAPAIDAAISRAS